MSTIEKKRDTLSVYALTVFVCASLLLSVQVASAEIGSAKDYDPVINPSDFSTSITNRYFSLPVGLKAESKGETEDGIETIEITVPGDTKMLMGVKTLVYRDKVWLDGELIEDTKDYLAQDKEGNVWYFGEDVKNYENGKLKDTHGSWLAGVDGALPGIWMEANPKVGDEYRQEYYKGEAEDTGKVISVSRTVTVPAGKFTNCLQTLDQNPLEPRSTDEYKYFCPEVKGFVLETDLEGGERIELVKVTQPNQTENSAEIAKLQTIIKLLLQVIELLKQKAALM